MSGTEGEGPAAPKYQLLPEPPPPEAGGPRLENLSEEELEYVIEDLEAAESPTGGAAARCVGCGCYCIA